MISKAKKTPERIKEEILDELKKGPKTISELSDKIGSNWLTIEKFLNELIGSEDKKVSELISAQKSKVYCSKDDLAFYCLPFSEDIRKKTISLLYTISKKWEKRTGQQIPRTKLQKIAVRFAEESNLEKIPVLRFHYGQTLALRYEYDLENYELFNLTPKQNASLLQLIDDYNKKTLSKIKEIQYEKEGMEIYKEKEIKQKECLNNFEKEKFKEFILTLSAYYPFELEESFEVFDKMVYCVVNILNLKNSEEYQNKLKEIFTLTWDCLTTESFFYDAQKWISSGKLDLFNQIKKNVLNSKILNVENILIDFQEEIESLSDEEFDESDDEKSDKLLHLLLE